MTATTSYKWAAVNENWAPLSGVEVEALNLTTLKPDDVQRTGLDGIVTFTGLPAGPHIPRVRARRVSTKVGGRTYTGQVRLIPVAMGNQGITKHYVVDANGMGTHTTIQAAVTAAVADTTEDDIVIYINPGSITENVTVAPTDAKHIVFIAEGCLDDMHNGGYNAVVSVTVASGGDASPVFAITGTACRVSFIGLEITGVTGSAVSAPSTSQLAFTHCKIATGSTTEAVVCSSGYLTDTTFDNCVLVATNVRFLDSTSVNTYIHRCYVNCAGLITSGVSNLHISNSRLIPNQNLAADEYFIHETGGISSSKIYIQDCYYNGGGLGLLTAGRLTAGFVVVGNHIIMGASDIGIALAGAEEGTISGNIFEGAGSSDGATGINLAASIVTCAGLAIVGNTFVNIQTGINVASSATDGTCVIGPNAYHNVGTATSGVPAAEDYQVSLATASCALLDGTIHTDTVAQGVTAGSIIIGNDTPAWDELAIAVPAANVRNVLGIDNGETVPSWKTALDGTVPTTIAESAVAAPGTSLVFSHRDHTHGAPATWAATAHALDGAVHTGVADYASVLGLASLTIADANFGLALSTSNPRITLDSGDYLEYNRASNYLYHNRDFLVDGHMAIGGAALDATDVAVEIGPTYTHTSGLARGLRSYVTANPGASTSAQFQGIRAVVITDPTNVRAFTATQGLVALAFAAQHWGSGLVTGLYGANFYADIGGSGNVTDGMGFRMRGRTFADSTGKFVNYYNLYIDTFLVSGSGAADNLYGIYIADLSQGTSLNYAIYLAGTSGLARQGIWWNGDTNLYRSAANVLKTDDSFVVGADLNVTTETYLGLHTLTGDNQADVLLFSNAAGSHAQAGNFDNKLKIYGGGGQGRRMELYQDYAGEAYVQSYAAELHLRTTSNDKNIVLTPDGTGLVRVVGPLQGEADVYFTGDGSGLPYGHMHGYNISETVGVAATDTFYELTTGLTGGELNLVTLGTAHELTVTKAGRYLITWSMSVRTGTANDEVEGSIAVNNTASTTAAAHTTLPKANASTTLAGSTVLDLAATDDISMAVMNHTAIRDIVVEHVTCSVVMVGGT